MVFTARDAVLNKQSNVPSVLIRLETSPEDIAGMEAAEGVLTARGGMTSHAAVVARGMGCCCVAGCEDLKIGHSGVSSCLLKQEVVRKGDWITLDGTTGEVLKGKVGVREAVLDVYFTEFMGWADEVREMEVFTNADTAVDAHKALVFGAQGIGLVRTEHQFFQEERLKVMREMILAEGEAEREEALELMLPFQRDEFVGLFKGKFVLSHTVFLFYFYSASILSTSTLYLFQCKYTADLTTINSTLVLPSLL